VRDPDRLGFGVDIAPDDPEPFAESRARLGERLEDQAVLVAEGPEQSLELIVGEDALGRLVLCVGALDAIEQRHGVGADEAHVTGRVLENRREHGEVRADRPALQRTVDPLPGLLFRDELRDVGRRDVGHPPGAELAAQVLERCVVGVLRGRAQLHHAGLPPRVRCCVEPQAGVSGNALTAGSLGVLAGELVARRGDAALDGPPALLALCVAEPDLQPAVAAAVDALLDPDPPRCGLGCHASALPRLVEPF
jgi:hypothetical protein